MSDAILPLRAAIQAVLERDPALIALIGPGRVFDEAPRAIRGVYLVHGEAEARDWSTGSGSGCEQELSLVVWAGESSSVRTALEAAALAALALDEAKLAPVGHRLVDLRWQGSRLSREAKTGIASVTLRFRAVTERL
ncbi:hypothetical protein ASG72_17180 [Bosea sp. Leaf344]|uniref:DUF3168 domain-containing protein n=1 Tax=Bosea sp. Leaf344 TaxID=1736346 RepID=UPI0006F792D7|nr:DUF3168 domain-containing protein [Bosea sp. Leaf344]KQU50352.1 hypothetical protein ASG72_17180 [Bosea sp. Leaf344]